MKYLKVWTDFEKVLAPLELDEIGSLFLAMLHYAADGSEPTNFVGNESFLWAVAKRDIDTMSEKDEKLRQNGMKGGRPKTKQNQTEPNVDVGFESEPNKSLKEKKRNEIKINEIKRHSFLEDDEAHEIQNEQNRVLDAAEDAGFDKSNSVRAGLLKLYEEHGLEKVLHGIESCVEHGAPNLAYLKACMTDKPKPNKKSTNVLTAQDFPQRDYTDVNGQMMTDLAAEIAAFNKGAG